ncbi:MAG: pilus assembly protein PilM [Planctomycetes bacterium]|nr:pilus assembly protein PilM [Planctomycetota bacterium]
MSRGIGVEISDHRVRVAVVEHSAKRVRLISFHEEPVAHDDKKTYEDVVSESLKTAMTQVKARGRLAASLDSGDAIVRELSLPFKSPEQIQKTYRFELESLIHNHSIEDLVCDYFTIGESEKGANILAAAVPRKIVQERLRMFQKAGLDPAWLDLDVAALFNAISHVGAVDTDEPFLIVYGTSRFTKIILIEKRRPRSLRTIRFSFPTPDQAEHEQQERKKNREWKSQELDHPVPIVILSEGDSAKFADLDLEQRASLMEILSKEIARFLLANAAAATPSHILLTGEYEVEEAAQMLEAGTQLPVKRLDILGRLEHAFAPEQAQTAAHRAPVAIGLALKAAETDELGLDFRRHEFSYSKKYDTIKTTALVTLELVIVFLAAVALHFYHFRTPPVRDAYDQMLQHQAALYKDATGEAVAPEEAYPKLVAKRQELEARLGGGDHPIDRSAADMDNQFFQALAQLQAGPPQLGGKDLYCLIDSLKVSQTTTQGNESIQVEIQAVTASIEWGDALLKKVKSTAPFSESGWSCEIDRYVPTKDDMYQFTLRMKKSSRAS